jgi:hypothetical protein
LKKISSEDAAALNADAANGLNSEVLSRVLGGKTTADGIWRFFSDIYPEPGGVTYWNSLQLWRDSWPSLRAEVSFWGEDIFGNQLAMIPQKQAVWLWNHENGEMVDLLLDPLNLLKAIVGHGLGWIDFYAQGVLEVASLKAPDVPDEYHLHWTQPLILGGTTVIGNTSLVERVAHLRGHGKLWKQIQQLPPGSDIVVKRQEP